MASNNSSAVSQPSQTRYYTKKELLDMLKSRQVTNFDNAMKHFKPDDTKTLFQIFNIPESISDIPSLFKFVKPSIDAVLDIQDSSCDSRSAIVKFADKASARLGISVVANSDYMFGMSYRVFDSDHYESLIDELRKNSRKVTGCDKLRDFSVFGKSPRELKKVFKRASSMSNLKTTFTKSIENLRMPCQTQTYTVSPAKQNVGSTALSPAKQGKLGFLALSPAKKDNVVITRYVPSPPHFQQIPTTTNKSSASKTMHKQKSAPSKIFSVREEF